MIEVHTDGSDLMPAFWIAMTKGEDAAVPSVRFRPSEFDGTSRPIIIVPPI